MTTAAAATTRVSERRGDRAQRPQAAQPAEPQRREPHGDVLRLQRMAGNRAVTHLLASGRPSLQRKCASCASGGATCEHCAEEDKRLQRKAAGGQPRGRLSHVHQLLRTPGEVLNPAVATSMGDRFGADFSSVRVHRDSGAAESARRVDALAYTVGGHIVFGRGQYDPDSGPGQRLIAHELTHVLQQGGGGLPPRGLAVDDNPAREAEADRAASSATDGARHPAASTQRTAPSVVARQATVSMGLNAAM